MAWSLKRLWPRGGLWGHRDFVKLWTGQTISEFGSQITLLALPLVAIDVLHASAFAVAALGVAEQLPFLLLALPAGVWIDRLARRPVLVLGDLGRALALATIPVAQVFDALSIWQLYGVGLAVGVLTVFFDVAYQSYLPSLVDREQLVEGNSKLQVTASGAQIGGPGFAGALIGLATAPFAIIADAVSFVLSSAFVVAIRKREAIAASSEPRGGMKIELMEGVRHVLGNAHLRAIAACTANSNFFGAVAWAILVVYFRRRLELSASLIGIILSCANVGLLIGALTAGWLARTLGVGRLLMVTSVIVGPSLLMIPAAPMAFPVPVIVLALMLFGFSGVVYNITQISLRQAITPEGLQGRMNSVMRFIVWGVLPLGSLLGGVLATTIGLRMTLAVGGIGAFLSWVPIYFSPVRRLGGMPLADATAGALEAGMVAGLAGGVDAEGLVAGAHRAKLDA